MSAQLGIQRPTLTGEILHLRRKMRAIPAQALDEQELKRSRPGDVEGQLDAVMREFHGSSPYSPTCPRCLWPVFNLSGAPFRKKRTRTTLKYLLKIEFRNAHWSEDSYPA